MTATLGIFVSSVQKELEDERLIVQNLVSTDPFLSAHCVPVLYEFEPASPVKALDGCLEALGGCNVYLLIVGVQYGTLVGEISITHAEYRRAKESGIPVLAFIDRNTRHPMRIVGLNRVRLDEYPVDALREALVNAVAHRQYEDAGRKIILEVFADRLVLSSPGLPPRPITLASLRRGKYRPCSRNPVLAQCLSYFHRIEERGSGFRRMREQMLDHGLDQPLLGAEMGYFQVTFPGPGDNIERLRVPEKRLLVTPAVEAQLNERQKKMILLLVQGETLTSRLCEEQFRVTRDTAVRDFKLLVESGLAKKEGKGRSVRYIWVGTT